LNVEREPHASPEPLVLFRLGKSADQDFILSSWLRSCRNRHYFDAWENPAYFNDATGYQAIIKAILGRPETVVTIACTDDDEDQILGYAVTAPRTVHYVYVKQPFRKRGFAKALVWRTVPTCGREICKCGAINSIAMVGPIMTRPTDGVLVQALACGKCGAGFRSRHDAMTKTTCTQTMYGWRELAERFRLVFNPWA
jgi:GNAT superfamily N-acetyltransferase